MEINLFEQDPKITLKLRTALLWRELQLDPLTSEKNRTFININERQVLRNGVIKTRVTEIETPLQSEYLSRLDFDTDLLAREWDEYLLKTNQFKDDERPTQEFEVPMELLEREA